MFSSTALITVMAIATTIAAVNLGVGLSYARRRRVALAEGQPRLEKLRAEIYRTEEYLARLQGIQKELDQMLYLTELRLQKAQTQVDTTEEANNYVEYLRSRLSTLDRRTELQYGIIQSLMEQRAITPEGARRLREALNYSKVKDKPSLVEETEEETQDR